MLESLERSLKTLLKNYQNEISDAVIFGSALKEKSKPGDVDICILFKRIAQEKVGKILSKMKNEIPKNVHMSWIFVDEMLTSQLSKTLIEEGYSLSREKFLHEIIGYDSGVIFSFKLDNLEKNKKVLFSYALHGKNTEGGMLKMANGLELGRAVVLIPVEKSEDFREFLEGWSVNFKMRKVLLG